MKNTTPAPTAKENMPPDQTTKNQHVPPSAQTAKKDSTPPRPNSKNINTPTRPNSKKTNARKGRVRVYFFAVWAGWCFFFPVWAGPTPLPKQQKNKRKIQTTKKTKQQKKTKSLSREHDHPTAPLVDVHHVITMLVVRECWADHFVGHCGLSEATHVCNKEA